MKKLLVVFASIIYLAGIFYLTRPNPPIPDLSSSQRSVEPGDTWQHPDQKAFYTSKTRQQVISEINSSFPGYRLNYPPEESQTLVRDQVKANYLEEIVQPLRVSLFINGWEPQNSPMFSYLPESTRPYIEVEGVRFPAKITLRPVVSTVPSRLLIWTLIFPSIYLVYLSLKLSLNEVV